MRRFRCSLTLPPPTPHHPLPRGGGARSEDALVPHRASPTFGSLGAYAEDGPLGRDMGSSSNTPQPAATARTVECYHCRESFDVPLKAMSISCPWCYKRVTLDDVVVKETCWQSKLQTCGRLLVQQKGSLVASLIEARQGIEILGHAEGTITSGGPVLIGPKARVKGDVTAPSIWMEPGAIIEGGYFRIVGPDRLAKGPSKPPQAPAPVVVKVNDRSTVVIPAWRPIMKPG